MANRKIWMADVNGTNAISFDLLRVSTPYPELNIPSNGAKPYQMRINSLTKGNRVWSYGGVDENHNDIPFKLFIVSQSELTKLKTWYSNRPPVILFSNDDRTTRYFAIFPEGGLEILGEPHNENMSIPQALHNNVAIRLSILTQTTQTFS